jgi:hypothetical protein
MHCREFVAITSSARRFSPALLLMHTNPGFIPRLCSIMAQATMRPCHRNVSAPPKSSRIFATALRLKETLIKSSFLKGTAFRPSANAPAMNAALAAAGLCRDSFFQCTVFVLRDM